MLGFSIRGWFWTEPVFDYNFYIKEKRSHCFVFNHYFSLIFLSMFYPHFLLYLLYEYKVILNRTSWILTFGICKNFKRNFKSLLDDNNEKVIVADDIDANKKLPVMNIEFAFAKWLHCVLYPGSEQKKTLFLIVLKKLTSFKQWKINSSQRLKFYCSKSGTGSGSS